MNQETSKKNFSVKHLNKKFTCEYCHKRFTRKNNMVVHQKTSCQFFAMNPNVETMGMCIEKKKQSVILSKDCEEKLEKLEKELVDKGHRLEKMEKRLDEKDKQIAELKENPRVNNQILQVVCISNKDNYLDMLTQQWGDFDKALQYIKNCALSEIKGDCKLIEKIYLTDDDGQPINNIYYADKNRTKIVYYNEKKQKIKASKDLFFSKIANNLQNSLPF